MRLRATRQGYFNHSLIEEGEEFDFPSDRKKLPGWAVPVDSGKKTKKEESDEGDDEKKPKKESKPPVVKKEKKGKAEKEPAKEE